MPSISHNNASSVCMQCFLKAHMTGSFNFVLIVRNISDSTCGKRTARCYLVQSCIWEQSVWMHHVCQGQCDQGVPAEAVCTPVFSCFNHELGCVYLVWWMIFSFLAHHKCFLVCWLVYCFGHCFLFFLSQVFAIMQNSSEFTLMANALIRYTCRSINTRN